MNTKKARHQFYLPDHLSARLDTLAAKPGASKTAILTEALAALLEGKASSTLDAQFGTRLDRQDRTVARLEQKIDVLGEVLGLFIQHQLTLVAHQPPFAAETTALGRDRYLRLLEAAGRKAAGHKGQSPPQAQVQSPAQSESQTQLSSRGTFDGLNLNIGDKL